MQNYKDNQREDVEIAYIAGLIDGEGCIRMQKQYDRKDWSPKYTPSINFTNTNRESVELISEFFGGTKIFEHYSGDDGFNGNKVCYRTQISGKNLVMNILKKLIPYLRIKKREAELIVEYVENFIPARGVGRNVKNGKFTGGRKILPKEAERREKIYQELKKIHGYITRRD